MSGSLSASELLLKKGDIVYIEVEQDSDTIKTIMQIREIEGDKLFSAKSITYDSNKEQWRKTEEILRELSPDIVEKYMSAEDFQTLLENPAENSRYVKRHITPEEFDLIMDIYDNEQ